MKNTKSILLLLALIVSFLPAALTYADTTNSIRPELRQGSFSCDSATIDSATALHKAGWTYIMPQPKSAQAAWGNRDGRTTWYIGYWKNDKDRSTSLSQPVKNDAGQFVGDGKGGPAWRRGGSPRTPTKIEWLCSNTGGVPPN